MTGNPRSRLRRLASCVTETPTRLRATRDSLTRFGVNTRGERRHCVLTATLTVSQSRERGKTSARKWLKEISISKAVTNGKISLVCQADQTHIELSLRSR